MGLLLGLEMKRRRHVYDNDDDETKQMRAMPSNKMCHPRSGFSPARPADVLVPRADAVGS